MPSSRNEVVVLALLAEQPSYGYEIEAQIEQRGLNRWAEVSFSSIYYLLGKLEKAGLIDFEYQKHGRYPTRKVYHLTGEGRRMLRANLYELIGNYHPSPPPSIVGISFIHVLPKELALEALEVLEASIADHLEKFRDIIGRVKKRYPLPTVRELLHLGEIQSSQALGWVRNLIDILSDYDWDRWAADAEGGAVQSQTHDSAAENN